jgi:ribosomal-protein-alanine N-acetyltransferase
MQLALKSRTLRRWRWDDAESLVKHANNRKVWLGLHDLFPRPYTSDDAHKFLQKTIDAEPVTNLCIEVEGLAAGVIDIRIAQDAHRHTAALGYWLGKDFWGRGIMT